MTSWPVADDELAALQRRIADEADALRLTEPYRPGHRPLVGGCFLAYARGEAGPGHPGDRAWAAAVTWRPTAGPRDAGAALRGVGHRDGPRRATDLHDQVVVAGTVPASYRAGLLAEREGPLLHDAVGALAEPPDVLLVDATGLDHPRRAGLAVHLGWVLDVPTVGVTHRPLHARGSDPPTGADRGTRAPVLVEGEAVAQWVVTAPGARAVVAHAGWRTTAETAAQVVLLASTAAARTPVPLAEARRAAREARAIAGGTW